MSKTITPIIRLKKDDKDKFPINLEDLFEQEGFKQDDHFTYTTRYTLPEDNYEIKQNLRAKIREQMKDDPERAERFIRLMDEHEWDVSFLVDCY
jgi:hypothetical protein